MFKNIINLLKRIIISSFLIYGYNLLVQPIGITIPINLITITLISILGIPSLLSLIFLLIFVY